MNVYHTLTVGDVGVTLGVSIWSDESADQVYDYQIQCNGRGFNLDRRVRERGQRNTVVVDFESFLDPKNIQPVEMEALTMFVEHWNRYDKILVGLGSNMVRLWSIRASEQEIEKLVRQRLKLLEE